MVLDDPNEYEPPPIRMTSPPRLPFFRFHPDPIGSGSVVASDNRCQCCGKKRGWIYIGPVYAAAGVADDALCPWCIADGTAHARLGAEFVDSEAFAEPVTDALADEVINRTPGFATWQSERWLSCCGEPAAFITPAGRAEIAQRFPRLEAELMGHIVHELEISGAAAHSLLASLHREHGPTAYVFQCRKCERHLAYINRP